MMTSVPHVLSLLALLLLYGLLAIGKQLNGPLAPPTDIDLPLQGKQCELMMVLKIGVWV